VVWKRDLSSDRVLRTGRAAALLLLRGEILWDVCGRRASARGKSALVRHLARVSSNLRDVFLWFLSNVSQPAMDSDIVVSVAESQGIFDIFRGWFGGCKFRRGYRDRRFGVEVGPLLSSEICALSAPMLSSELRSWSRQL
jgi:hypothetical protein